MNLADAPLFALRKVKIRATLSPLIGKIFLFIALTDRARPVLLP
jgi:hypothetical protein